MARQNLSETQKQEVISRWESNIPQELKELQNWVMHKSKVPYSVYGGKAKSNDPDTWAFFKAALNSFSSSDNNYDGIGFEFGRSGYLGIDIDHCIAADGTISEMATDILHSLPKCYAEISPSGTGLHIIVKGAKPAARCKNSFPDGQAVEMYDTDRYFTVTGNVYEDNYNSYCDINQKPEDARDAVQEIYDKYVRKPETKTSTPAEACATCSSYVTADYVVARIEAGKGGNSKRQGDGERVRQLWRGDWQAAGYKSHSEGDLALADVLAFWCNKDKILMEQLFMRSGLYRSDKWLQTQDETTYGNTVITKAVENTRVTYTRKSKENVAIPPVLDDSVSDVVFPYWTKQRSHSPSVPMASHFENTQVMLDHLGIELRFNEITHVVEINILGEAYKDNFDSFLTLVRSRCHEQDLLISKADLHDNCRFIAGKNAYNPMIDYFEKCYNSHNKGVGCEDEFDKLCQALPLTCSKQEQIFCYWQLRLWLRQVVYLAGNDGSVKPQSILVLKGSQGIGKSSFVRTLLPIHDLVLTEQRLDFGSGEKDNRILCTSTGICELSELGSTVKDANRCKQFITSERDHYRAPYDRVQTTYPRRTSYVGTVNDATFLIDKTGERRYFVLPLSGIDWNILNNLDFSKLWAFIFKECKLGETYTLNQSEILKINATNNQYSKLTDIEQVLFDCLDWNSDKQYWVSCTPTNLCVELMGKPDKANVMGRRLQELADRGIIEQPSRAHGVGGKLYKVPPKRVTESIESTLGTWHPKPYVSKTYGHGMV